MSDSNNGGSSSMESLGHLAGMLGDRGAEVFDSGNAAVDMGSSLGSEDFDSNSFLEEEEGQEQQAAEAEGTEGDSDSFLESEDQEAAVQDSANTDIEELVVTGPKGKRKIKLDYSDKDSIKKYVQLAHGARKWQAERDQARTELGTVKQELESTKKDWDLLEGLYQKGGIKAIADRLEPGQWDQIINDAIAERERLANMDPSERRELEFQQYQEQQARRERELESKYKQQLEQLEQVKAETMTKDIVAKASGALGKYGFEGKLGNPDLEYELNDRVWSKALQTLEQLPEDVEITQAMIDREFRNQSIRQQKLFNLQSTSTTKKAVSKAKEKAQSKAKAIAHTPKAATADRDKFRQEVRSGDWREALNTFVNGKLQQWLLRFT